MLIRVPTSWCVLLAAGLAYLSSSVSAAPLHSVMLTVPAHAEEALTWCGPATGQMIMEGYPSGSCSVLQEDVWMSIQANKTETQWDTDPDGLKEALKTLCPPAFTWNIRARTDASSLMHSVAYWMTNNNYPAAGLLDTLPHNSYSAHSEHWVAIRGIITDADPTTSTTVNLEFVWFNDPAVALGDPALVRFVTGTTWYAEMLPVSKPASTYAGKYVAVIEPPEITGTALAPVAVLAGRLIKPGAAVEFANQWIRDYKLYENPPFHALKNARALTPMLVNADHGGYYIVPYAAGKTDDKVSNAVIVNAYSGAFQEVGAFEPVAYLTKKAAFDIAVKQLGRKQDKAARLNAELVYPQGERVVSRYFPIWKVTLDDKTIGVGRAGNVYTQLPSLEFSVSVPATKPAGLAWDGQRLWTLDRQTKSIASFDSLSGTELSRFEVSLEAPKHLAFDGSSLWIVDEEAKKVVAVDPQNGEIRRSFTLPIPAEKGFNSVEGLTWDGRFLWAAYFAGFSSSLNQIDPNSGKIVKSVFADCSPRGLAASGEHLWTLCYNGASNTSMIDQRKISGPEHEMLRSRSFIKGVEGKAPSGLVYDGQYLWYGDQLRKNVSRVHPGISTK